MADETDQPTETTEDSPSQASSAEQALRERLERAKAANKERVIAFGQVPGLDVPGRETQEEPPPLDAQSPPADTESLLNSMIAECHYLMREVAFRSMCQTRDAHDRVRFMASAMNFATTGAKLAETIVHLRNGDVPGDVRRTHHTMTLERKIVGEGGRG